MICAALMVAMSLKRDNFNPILENSVELTCFHRLSFYLPYASDASCAASETTRQQEGRFTGDG